ncbi:PaaI family thioesterase [Streptomyces sp. SID13031]|uniref:PaaI family thioesterase n=1 Tax=Streptomyces sp. SID13031 TaxID=2706046 RepID=UPI0013C895E0|nr:PaaI family thioesterase [Streptomyces sp. SID13031]NEA30482.1 PaaI family thioesterase [Streptomyces sp. SID13031]
MTKYTAEELTKYGAGALPGLIGIEFTSVEAELIKARTPVRAELLAPNGYLHAGTVVSIADTLCGYGTIVNLPEGATGFTTIELKSNFLGTAREGAVLCEARPIHLGRTTQVWDAEVTNEDTGRKIATFRCTQLILWPKQ